MRNFRMMLPAVAVLFALSTALVAQEVPKARVAGQLTRIDGKTITITTTADGPAKDTVITCNDATKFLREGYKNPVTFNDLKVGQSVRSYYTEADKIAVAVIIVGSTVHPQAQPGTPPAVRVAGQLTKIEGKALTITATVNGQAKDTVIVCNDATRFSRDGSKNPVTLSDLQVGQQVRAYYAKADNVAAGVIIAGAAPTSTPK